MSPPAYWCTGAGRSVVLCRKKLSEARSLGVAMHQCKLAQALNPRTFCHYRQACKHCQTETAMGRWKPGQFPDGPPENYNPDDPYADPVALVEFREYAVRMKKIKVEKAKVCFV